MHTKPKIVVIAIPPNAQSLDISGPLAAFREVQKQSNGKAKYEVKLMSATESKTVEVDGMTITTDTTIYDIGFPIDTLLVAGTDDYHKAFEMLAFQQWLQQNTPNMRRYGSVCTGAFFLGASGLLNGKRVTTHWQQAAALAKCCPEAEVHPDSIYIQDGALCTSAGITAGIDLSLKLIEDDYGRELALKIARRLVVFLRRPGGQSQFSTHLAAQICDDHRIKKLQQWILDHIKNDLSLPVLAAKVSMSTRNFSRVFLKETGSTPAAFVEELRVDAAKRLLEDSDLYLKEIAHRCGFTNVDLMRRAFIRRVGIGPSDYKKRF
ncbi:MAG TPA: AraC family transcriptional regulator [Microscillaceae bacterium]|nr:AraC family transcriptional regulator [Microscillaceae bacterium]